MHPVNWCKAQIRTVNHPEVERLYRENWPKRPATLNEWQQIFKNLSALSRRARSKLLGDILDAIACW